MVALGSLAGTLVDNHSTLDLSSGSTTSGLQGRRKVIVHFLLGYVALAEAEWRIDRVRISASLPLSSYPKLCMFVSSD